MLEFRAPIKSGLGRSIDPRIPSNLFIVLVAMAAGALAGALELINGDGLSASFGAGIQAGGAAFLGWAIARELDPDRSTSAALAALIGAGWAFFGDQSLLVGGAVLVAVRIASRTVGIALQPADLAVVVGLAAWTGSRPFGIVGVAALTIATIADRRSAKPVTPPWLPVASAVAGIATWFVWGSWPANSMTALSWTALGVTAVAGILSLRVEHPEATCDLSEDLVLPDRVQVSRILVLVSVGLLAGFGGAAGLAAAGPLAASLLGTASGRLLP